MPGPMVEESAIRERWLVVEGALDEHGRRMWAAAEASSHGRGGIAAVVRATGISEATVGRGWSRRAAAIALRRGGFGRRAVSPADRDASRAWSRRSFRCLTASPRAIRCRRFCGRRLDAGASCPGTLLAGVHSARERRTAELLKAMGTATLQANRKSREGSDHPGRDAQFRRIAEMHRRGALTPGAGDRRGRQEEG